VNFHIVDGFGGDEPVVSWWSAAVTAGNESRACWWQAQL